VLFTSLPFALFFALVMLGMRLLPPRARAHWLLATSLLFYACWMPSYLVLLLACMFVNHSLLRGQVRSARPRLWLGMSISFTLGVLSVFKYASFALDSLAPIFVHLGRQAPKAPGLVLPLGISFYSFQMISLAVDVYRGRFACPRLDRYMLYLAFFPHQIAGPILRGSQLIPQLDAGGAPSAARTRRGAWLLACGLLKKVVLADFLLAPYVNDLFAEPGAGSAPAQLLAVYGFAFQIYYDFSGYTDMARGLACMLGFELPLNFAEPYLSRNPVELWRRWHITLSEWLRDYLYIPLGGNKHGALRTSVHLLITMLLGGLWHGAAWTFVVWGAVHGLLLVAYRAVVRTPRHPDAPLRARDAPSIVACFHAVCLLWIFFRAPSLQAAAAVLRGLFTHSYLRAWPLVPTLLVAACAALHVGERLAHRRVAAWQTRIASAAWGPAFEGAVVGAVAASVVLASGAGAEFIYFQF
jgi:D-alanyl-lipoteichoic acid acyltransferase DltB (MBOAT superfamily)